MSRIFIARFPGNTCPHCHQPITAGQRAQYIDDDLTHVSCPPKATFCPTHGLQLPATGRCDECEEP